MAPLPAWFLPTLLLQAFGRTREAIRGRRQVAIMAVFGELPFERFDTLLQHINLSFQCFGMFLQPLNRLDRFLESITDGLLLYWSCCTSRCFS